MDLGDGPVLSRSPIDSCGIRSRLLLTAGIRVFSRAAGYACFHEGLKEVPCDDFGSSAQEFLTPFQQDGV
jgi:hypothetical protein